MYWLDWITLQFSDEKDIRISRLAIKKSTVGLHLIIDSPCLKFLGEGEWNARNLTIDASGINYILIKMLASHILNLDGMVY